MALFKRVRSDPTLRRICELAGRYRRVAQSRQRRKTTHGLDDVVGVVMDADLGRLLPQERRGAWQDGSPSGDGGTRAVRMALSRSDCLTGLIKYAPTFISAQRKAVPW